MRGLFALHYPRKHMSDYLGAELWLGNMLALRGGYKFSYDVESWSAGVGMNYKMSEGRHIGVDVSVNRIRGVLDENPARLTISGSF